MALSTTKRKRTSRSETPSRGKKRKVTNVSTSDLTTAVSQLDPNATHTNFTSLPLSEPTFAGLKAAHFSTLTDIQAKAIPLALQSRDILGAAKTGSGKTLAFLIPVLENLYREQCIGQDAGLGAMIISPTRELAIQIFDVLRKIGGRGHLFAAGLIIGGKSLQVERDALSRMNIVVCTPGRILQHLSQTAGFNVDNLRMLVLDEADRIMDMGFQKDVDAIIEYLPSERQTLLFSATQTKRVSDLSRLALRDPEYISVHSASTTSTPQTLQQNYTLTPLAQKLDTLWSFLQSTKKSKSPSKVLVFLSSGKQVRFLYESFRHLQPGIPLLHLHGRQKQTARLEITEKFSRAKHSCLFATDVVARGLDFPAVDWVIQVDCPEDADTYIHRVGRTARYEKVGRAVLFLDPSEEEGMLKALERKRVPIERIHVRANKQTSIQSQVQEMCFHDTALKYLGQKAFSSYVRSLHIQKDKEVFKLGEYDLEGFAASLGLPGAPRIKFLKADEGAVKQRKNAPRMGREVEEDEEGEGEVGETEVAKKDGVRTKYDRMFERQNQDVLARHYRSMVHDDDEEDGGLVQSGRLDDRTEIDDGDDWMNVKRRIPVDEPLSSDEGNEEVDFVDHVDDPNGNEDAYGHKSISIPGAKTALLLDSKRREKLLKSKKKLHKLKDKGSKLVFDDEGQAHEIYELEDEEAFKARGAANEQRKRFLAEEAERVKVADAQDKEVEKGKKRAKKEKRKERERAEDAEAGGAEVEGGVDAFADFVADAEGADGGSDEEDVEDEPTVKRRKKWFENDKCGGSGAAEDKEIGTLDELEAEAQRLLG